MLTDEIALASPQSHRDPPLPVVCPFRVISCRDDPSLARQLTVSKPLDRLCRRKSWVAGTQASEATPFFEQLCPAMTGREAIPIIGRREVAMGSARVQPILRTFSPITAPREAEHPQFCSGNSAMEPRQNH